MLFTYELLGFSHFDIDEVFDWTRVSDSIRARAIDEPWIRFDTQSPNSSEELQSVSLFPANVVGNETQKYIAGENVEVVFNFSKQDE